MLYLFLAVLCTASISILMKLSGKYSENEFGLFLFNYSVCSIGAFLMMPKGQPLSSPGMLIVLVLGIFTGILFVAGFFLIKKNMILNGLVMTSIFNKLNVLGPVLTAVLFFRETPTAVQLAGLFLCVTAIVLMNQNNASEGKKTEKNARWLLILLLTGAASESLVVVYNKVGTDALKDCYIFVTFFTAFLISCVLTLKEHKKIELATVVFGILVGIPNLFCTKCLLLAMQSIPASVVYPVFSAGGIAITTLFGLLVLKEKMNQRKAIGVAMLLAAIVLLNI